MRTRCHYLDQRVEDLAREVQPLAPHLLEFHSSHIFNRKTALWSGMTKEQCREVILKLCDAVAGPDVFRSMCTFACVVDKAAFPGRDPMEVAFEELCSRFDLLLKRKYAQGDTQRGLLVLDKTTYETSLQQMARNFKQFGTRWNNIRNLVDVPVFIDSRASRLVQLADLVAYATYRRYEAHDATFFDRIAQRFDAEEGKIHGLVHRNADPTVCLCPGCLSRR